MESKVCILLFALLGVGVALAGGRMEAAAGLAGAGPYASARQLMAVAPTRTTMMSLEVHRRRRILGSISTSSLDPNKPACIKACPAAGGPYTNRGCLNVYQCRG
ncbi:hypothetical protein HU200_056594 [Digitaria exilis]|uniref:Uncharacterized protein n=1 Tax=Digitaria exilis TaxID=1010633 RepID=A0A835E5Q5_9POAL|nr:hypothetical protein HU200_056594 [Digitaria exilis]